MPTSTKFEHEVRHRHLAGKDQIQGSGQDVARDGAHEQRGAEGAAHAAAGVREGHRKHLEQQDQREEPDRSVGLSVQEMAHVVISFAVQRREQEDQQAQAHGAEHPAEPGILHLPETVLEPERHLDEIQRAEPAECAQDEVERDVPHRKDHERAGELGVAPEEEIGHHRRRHRGKEQRQEGAHRQVEKENLQGEEDAGERGVEDTRHRAGGAAAQQERHPPVGKAHIAAQVGADGRARVHDRGLGAHGAAEPDRQGARHQRREHVVPLDLGFVLGHGLQDLRHAVADVVPDNVADDEETQEHAHAGKDQEQPVRVSDEGVQPVMDGADGHFEQHGGQPAEQAGHHRQDGDVAPLRQGMQKGP